MTKTEFNHIHFPLLKSVQFVLCCFQSPLLAASLLISFPTVTEMFHFTVFPLLPEQLENLWFNDRMRLARDYRSLPRSSSATQAESSTVWRIVPL